MEGIVGIRSSRLDVGTNHTKRRFGNQVLLACLVSNSNMKSVLCLKVDIDAQIFNGFAVKIFLAFIQCQRKVKASLCTLSVSIDMITSSVFANAGIDGNALNRRLSNCIIRMRGAAHGIGTYQERRGEVQPELR